MNARLAARLTGWKVDIQSDSEFAQAEAAAAFAGAETEVEEASGRCGAILSNGKRCPNASLPGSRYCGVPAHQALATQEASLPADRPEESEPASQDDVESLEPVARIEEPAGDAVVDAPTGAAGGSPDTAPPDAVPAGIPFERVVAGARPDEGAAAALDTPPGEGQAAPAAEQVAAEGDRPA
jgi:transcription termination/antitermination protein NusA